MKKSIFLFCLILFVVSCTSNHIEKPKNLIEKEKMVDILYDMSLLEAIRSQNIGEGTINKKSNEYVYKKYKIDSVQLIESNKYYASDIEEYKIMVDEVKARLEKEIKKFEKGNKNQTLEPNSDTPRIE